MRVFQAGLEPLGHLASQFFMLLRQGLMIPQPQLQNSEVTGKCHHEEGLSGDCRTFRPQSWGREGLCRNTRDPVIHGGVGVLEPGGEASPRGRRGGAGRGGLT